MEEEGEFYRTTPVLTDLIEFKGVKLGSRLGEKTLCGLAVRTVGFAEDGYS